jgi:hypothetical protein
MAPSASCIGESASVIQITDSCDPQNNAASQFLLLPGIDNRRKVSENAHGEQKAKIRPSSCLP